MSAVLNLVGIITIIAILWCLSYSRRDVDWKMIGKAFIAQIILALLVVKVPAGIWAIEQISNAVTMVIGYGRAGLDFVFGSLLDIPKNGFIFIIQALGNIIFVGALVSMLTYLGILGFVIEKIGKLVGKIMGTSQLETFISVANMFLGQTESPLLISKYLKVLTNSEIVMVLVAGMGSMSVSILGGYNAIGVPMEFLIITSALVPFGSIIVGKILLPEKDVPANLGELKIDRKSSGSNLIEAMSNGAMEGWNLVMAIASSLVAIVAVVAMVNGFLGNFGLELQTIFGWLFYPVSYLMALDPQFTQAGAEFLGSKLILNEFIAFDMLMKVFDSMDYRTQAMLCISIGGFANLGSMAVCLSSLGVLCPEKKSTVAKYVGIALTGAFCMNIMNAMIVGIILLF